MVGWCETWGHLMTHVLEPRWETSKTIQNSEIIVHHLLQIGSDWFSDFDVLNHIIPPISIINPPDPNPRDPRDPTDFSVEKWRGHGAQLSRRPAGSALHGGDQHDVCGARWTGETCVGSSRRRAAATGVPAVEMLEKGPCDSHVIPWEKLFGMLDWSNLTSAEFWSTESLSLWILWTWGLGGPPTPQVIGRESTPLRQS